MYRLISAALIALALTGAAGAQDTWPARPVRMIVPFPPGSSPDLVGRMLAEQLTPALGQQVIVENKPGAGGMVGTGQVANAAPDGYTIGLSIPGPLAVNTVLMRKMPYDPLKQLAPITLVAQSPNVLVVDPRLGATTLQDFIRIVKASPGKYNFGSVGNGSASHLTMELLKSIAGLDIVHVPYKGSPQVIQGMLSGDVAAAFIVPATAMPQVHAGKLLALASTSSVRTVALPDMPTVAELGYPGFESTAWLGMVAPAKTPPPIVERLSQELVKALRSPGVRERMLRIYFQPVGTAPEGLTNQMRSEIERWGKVIKAAGVTPG